VLKAASRLPLFHPLVVRDICIPPVTNLHPVWHSGNANYLFDKHQKAD
jgi:hypothetical protein